MSDEELATAMRVIDKGFALSSAAYVEIIDHLRTTVLPAARRKALEEAKHEAVMIQRAAQVVRIDPALIVAYGDVIDAIQSLIDLDIKDKKK